MTDDSRYREFFLKPAEIYHRQYEALRAFFVEGRRLEEIAQQFGYPDSGRCLRTRVAGLFLFLPLLSRLGFEELVSTADYPGAEIR